MLLSGEWYEQKFIWSFIRPSSSKGYWDYAEYLKTKGSNPVLKFTMGFLW
jgi:hypothetical protein